MMKRRSLWALAAAVAMASIVSVPAWANCIAHQPADMVFKPPQGLALAWDCVTAGPLYEHERRWYVITFKVTNSGGRRTTALKLQADLVDAFGDVVLSVPIVENANLGTGHSDAAVWAFHPVVSPNSIDHVSFHVLAVKFADGTLWKNPAEPKAGPTPPPRAALQRFSITEYDMGSVIAPSPSPTATRRHL